MIELTLTTRHQQPQDLFNKYHPINFESTYIRTHKIPSRTVLTSFAESCCMSSHHNNVPIYLSFYLLEPLMVPGSMRSSSSQVAPKGVHCIQTFCSAESCHTRLYSLSGTCFLLLQATRLSVKVYLRDPAPDDLKNKMEGKNKPGGIEIYKHDGNEVLETQWSSCDNGLRNPPFEILE